MKKLSTVRVIKCGGTMFKWEGVLDTGSVGNTTGEFIGSKGFISEDQMRIQDSYYYQDFSYVIKIGESINEW